MAARLSMASERIVMPCWAPCAWSGTSRPSHALKERRLPIGLVAIGNPILRQRWQHVLEGSGASVCVVVHPGACVSSSAQLAPGCVALAGAVINAVVDHYAICGPHSQLGVNAAMAGGSCLAPLAGLAAAEVLVCGEHRFAELELAPGAAVLSEGVSCPGSLG